MKNRMHNQILSIAVVLLLGLSAAVAQAPSESTRQEPAGGGKLTPPKGKGCKFFQDHSFGNSIVYRKECRNNRIVLEKTVLTTTVTANPDGTCDIQITATITTINTGEPCDSRTFQPLTGGAVFEEFNKEHAGIEREKQKQGKEERR